MKLRAALVACALGAVLAPPASAAAAPVDVLVYSATYGFRHASIDTAKVQFAGLGAGPEFDVTITEDPGDITAGNLARFDALVFLNATGNHPFSENQKRDVLDWLATGKGIVSTHASVDANYSWSDYGDVVGAYFHSHPHTGVAANVIEDKENPIVGHLPERFEHNDEYYRLQLDPRPNVHVLASLEKASMGSNGTTYVESQPVTWCQQIGGGRSFTTAWGHFDEVFTDAKSWTAIVQGLRWASGRLEADCGVKREPGRLQAEDADIVAGAAKGSSPFDGANQVVSRIQHDGYLLFRDLDLTGVKSVKVAAAPETVPTPSPYSLPQSTPALGGTVSVVLDDLKYDNQALGGSGATYKVAGSAELPAGRPPTTPANAAAWDALDVPIEAASGRHDVYVVFTNGAVSAFNPARVFAPVVQESMLLGSVDWVEFPGLKAPFTGSKPRAQLFSGVKLPKARRVRGKSLTLRFRAGAFPAGTRVVGRLGARGTYGRGSARVGGRPAALRIRLTPRAVKRLRAGRTITTRLRLTATAPNGTRAVRARRVTLEPA